MGNLWWILYILLCGYLFFLATSATWIFLFCDSSKSIGGFLKLFLLASVSVVIFGIFLNLGYSYLGNHFLPQPTYFDFMLAITMIISYASGAIMVIVINKHCGKNWLVVD